MTSGGAGKRAGRIGLAGVVTLGLLTQGGVHAQQTDNDFGSKLTLRFSESLVVDDNLGLGAGTQPTSVYSRTGLNLNFTTRTRTARFSLRGGVNYNAGRLGNSGTDGRFESRTLALTYRRQVGDSEFEFISDYRRTRNANRTEVDDLTGEDLIVDGGDVARWQNEFTLAIGQESTVGLILNGSRDDVTYTDNAVGGVDRTSQSLSLSVPVRVTPVAVITPFAGLSRSERDNAQEYTSENHYFGVSARLQAGEALTWNASIQHTDLDIRTTVAPGIRALRERKGVAANLGFNMARPNGTISGSVSTSVQTSGRQYNAFLRRELKLPRGSVGVQIGAGKSDTSDLSPLFGLDWTYDTRRAKFGATVRQQLTSDAGSESIVSVVSLKASGDLTETTSWSTEASYYDYDSQSAAVTDYRRLDLELGLTRDLTADWELTAGYRYRNIDRTGQARRSSNSVYVGLQREFSYRP